MQFANPIWLAGLAGISIPVAIHLLSRKEGKVIRIGSLRHLQETSTRQFKSLRLNEIVLLVLRSLLIVWLVMLLAAPLWSTDEGGKASWLLVEKGLEDTPALKAITDSLSKDFEVRAFADGFPLLSDSIAEAPEDYWALVDDLKEKSLQRVIVVAADRAAAYRGERLAIPENVTWLSLPLPSKEEVLTSIQKGEDSVWVRKASFDSERTTFETSWSSSTTVKPTDASTLNIALVKDTEHEYDSKIMYAALKAIRDAVPHHVNISVSNGNDAADIQADWIIWLSDAPVSTGKAKMIVMSAATGGKLLQRKTASTWILSRRLQPDAMLNENITLSLATLFFPEKELWAKAEAGDRRAVDERIMTARATNEHQKTAATSASFDNIWIILFTLTLLAERLIAYKRNQ